FPAGEAQQADKGVPEDGVAQVADVRRLVGIDAGVLNQNLPGWDCGCGFFIGGQSCGQRIALYPRVDVSRSGDFQLFEAFDEAKPVDNFLRYLARSLAEFFGEFKGQRQRVFSQLDLGRLLDDNFGQIKTVGAAQEVPNVLGEAVFQVTIQVSLSVIEEEVI